MSRLPILFALSLLLAACGGNEQASHGEGGHEEAGAADFERGPHRGRLLRDGDFALEITIFETNVPPQFHLYAYRDGKPLAPTSVTPVIELKRLDGEVNRFTFKAENDYLAGNATVVEPHSFDVTVSAQHDGKTHKWSFSSYEGRTTIPAAVAKEAGIGIEVAGPAVVRDTMQLMGTVVLDDNRHAAIKARFPGIVRAVNVQQGERVRRGQTLATIEANESMRTYAVTAPFDGIVLMRDTNVGDVAESGTLFEIADPSRVWVDLRAIGRDAERLAPGQAVKITSATSETAAEAKIGRVLPLASAGQSVIARVSLPNPEGRWRPGMMVAAEVTASARKVPLAVKESALQRFRDFTVVFAQVGDSYEVRMLELGERDGDYVEVLGGLKPGTRYVAEQSYLIRADIEKSGASHDH